jgi:histone-lysine N-methyltransferase SETMAR
LKGNLYLQGNAVPHETAITHQKLADFQFEVLKHPAQSSDLAPLDYYLFPNLKKHLKGRKFSSIEDCGRVVSSITKITFLGCVNEVRTTKS